MAERNSGCGMCDALSGVCYFMFENGEKPTLAIETEIQVPGEIEGPGIITTKGLVCSASGNFNLQQECNLFRPRTTADEDRDLNI